jgi:hypothetical protein
VLRKDKMNRAAQEAELAAADTQPKEAHH